MDRSEIIASKLSLKVSSGKEAAQPPHQCQKINSRDKVASTSRSSSISSPLKTTTPRISSNIHPKATGMPAYTILRDQLCSPLSVFTSMTPLKSDQSFLVVARHLRLLATVNSPSLHSSLLTLKSNLRRRQMLQKREPLKVVTLRSLQFQQTRLRNQLPKQPIYRRLTTWSIVRRQARRSSICLCVTRLRSAFRRTKCVHISRRRS